MFQKKTDYWLIVPILCFIYLNWITVVSSLMMNFSSQKPSSWSPLPWATFDMWKFEPNASPWGTWRRNVEEKRGGECGGETCLHRSEIQEKKKQNNISSWFIAIPKFIRFPRPEWDEESQTVQCGMFQWKSETKPRFYILIPQ